MGINNLWKILAPAAQKRSLLDISVNEGFITRRHGTGALVVGIDASPWLYSCQAVFSGHTHSQAGQNPELKALFFRLAALSRSAINAVFVFDGPDRPKRKRGRNVRSSPHWMTNAFQQLIVGFGFHHHQAPGEAEAELAFLNRSRYIDLVLTNDSDIFVFGATHVMRSLDDSDSKKHGIVEVYTASELSRQPSPATFSEAGLLFMAIVCGGDYNPLGLPGCGITIAKALASSSLAESLFDAAHNLHRPEFVMFLEGWRHSLQEELANNSSGRIGRKYPAVAAKMPADFPDPDVVYLYLHPTTSSAVQNIHPYFQRQEWHNPELPSTYNLAGLCSRLFDWGPVIISRLMSNVWDGYYIRKFVQTYNLSLKDSPDATNLLDSVKSKIRYISRAKIASPSSTFASYRAVVLVPNLVSEAASAVIVTSGLSSNSIHDIGSTIQMSIWIPEPIISAVADEKISEYHESHPYAILDQPSSYVEVLDN